MGNDTPDEREPRVPPPVGQPPQVVRAVRPSAASARPARPRSMRRIIGKSPTSINSTVTGRNAGCP
jgi:hypothetical protein